MKPSEFNLNLRQLHKRPRRGQSHVATPRDIDQQFPEPEVELRNTTVNSVALSPSDSPNRNVLVATNNALLLFLLTDQATTANSVSPTDTPLWDLFSPPSITCSPDPPPTPAALHRRRYLLCPPTKISVPEGVECVQWCPVDAATFAFATTLNQVLLYSVTATAGSSRGQSCSTPLGALQKQSISVSGRCICWHPSNRDVLAVATSKELSVIDGVRNANLQRTFIVCTSDTVGAIRDIQYSKQQEHWIAVRTNNGVYIFDSAKPEAPSLITIPTASPFFVTSFDFHPHFANIMAHGSQHATGFEYVSGNVIVVDLQPLSSAVSSSHPVNQREKHSQQLVSACATKKSHEFEIRTLVPPTRIQWRPWRTRTSSSYFRRSQMVFAQCGRGRELSVWDAAMSSAPLAELRRTNYCFADFAWINADEIVFCANKSELTRGAGSAIVCVTSVERDMTRMQGEFPRSAVTLDPITGAFLSVFQPSKFAEELWGANEEVESNAVGFDEKGVAESSHQRAFAQAPSERACHSATPPPQPSHSRLSAFLSNIFSTGSAERAAEFQRRTPPSELAATVDATPSIPLLSAHLPPSSSLSEILRGASESIIDVPRCVFARRRPSTAFDSAAFCRRARELVFGGSERHGRRCAVVQWKSAPFKAYEKLISHNASCSASDSLQSGLLRSLQCLVLKDSAEKVRPLNDTVQLQLVAENVVHMLNYASEEANDVQFCCALFTISRRLCFESDHLFINPEDGSEVVPSSRAAMRSDGGHRSSPWETQMTPMRTGRQYLAVRQCFSSLFSAEMERRAVEWAVEYSDKLEAHSLVAELCEFRAMFPPDADETLNTKRQSITAATQLRQRFCEASVVSSHAPSEFDIACSNCGLAVRPRHAQRPKSTRTHSTQVLRPIGVSVSPQLRPSAPVPVDLQHSSRRHTVSFEDDKASAVCNCIPYQCAVCQRALQGGEIYWWFRPCGHGGHVAHVLQWLNAGGDCCPSCGTALSADACGTASLSATAQT